MARDCKRDESEDSKERSKKRKPHVDEEESSKRQERRMKSDEEDGKRRDKDKDKHKHKHRKHKHRSHKKHKEEKEADADSQKEDSMAELDSSEQKIPGADETEDGEILEPKPRGDSPDRKRRSRSRDSHGGSRHYSRGASPDRKRLRSRSRDRHSRRYGYSPDRRRRSRSRDYDDARRRSRSRDYDDSRAREYDERDRYNRRRGESRDRSYRDDRGSRDDYHRDRERATVNRRDRDETGDKQEQNTTDELAREEENQDEYLERVAHQLAEQEEDIEKIKEESRKRRQAIMEKYKKQEQHQDGEEVKKSGAEPSPLPAQEPDSGEGIIDPSTPLSLGKPSQNGSVSKKHAGGLGEGSPPKSERSADMFCDIFGESPAEVRKVGKGDNLAVDTSGLTDNWDDAEGYYTYRIGEVLDSRYEIASSHGRGVFSTVVRARDTKAAHGDPEEVAIKIIRSNETMFKAGQRELVILKKLAGADPENKRHCVRLLSSFEYRNHLCLVFESLHMNLREILKKFGRNIGIRLVAVRSYAKQLFTALKHLRNCGVLHCDIKPDNMLVNDTKNLLKLCDFGSAMFAGENEITPYLVSRFYRAPEIILGLPYDHALDMWSVGCCLYELYSGKVLFPGATNNDMLRLHMELKGLFPKKMLRKAAFASQHFDQDFNFHALEEDPVTKKPMKRPISNVKPKDISSLIGSPGSGDEDPKMLASFKLLLEKIFILDPEKRLTVSQALNHPFIKG